MKKRIIAICACALAFCAPAADSKIATRDWVIKQLATSGISVSTATTTHNTNGTFTVTCPFTSDTLTNCVLLSLTFTEPAIVSATPVLRKALLRSAEISDNKVQITLTQGAWTDAAGNEHTFNFGDGYTFTWPEELPEVPSEDHVCELNENCYCIWYNRVPKYPDDFPEEYRLKTMDDFDNASFADIISWIDTASWEDQTTVAGKTRYWITDIDGSRLNLEQIGKIDLWRNSVSKVEDKINERLRECCEAFIKSCECKASNPQHDWKTTTCGSHSWSVCRNNSAHTQGTEGHDFPYVGGNYTATHHSCKCGDRIEAHGTLVPDGERTPTYNSDSKEDGWTQTWVCPSGCGYSKIVTHVHHFTNCGTCDAGDDCDTVCTGCSGNHVFGNATADECAKCECTMCDDCNAHPDETDITKHSGWMPCSQDVEGDNDDGTANGAHCQCQCLTFGHNANTAHNYQGSAGMAAYEQITDKNSAAFGQNYHYHILGQCTRCNQWKKQLDAHSWPQTPTEYRYVSDSVCAYLYECDKCQKKKREEDHGHSLPSAPEVCLNVSASVCRKKFICNNCKGVIPVDGGHVRGDGCKCANGCGRQLDHEWTTDACGNRKCSHCGTKDESQAESHSGWTSISSSEHKCACGEKTEAHGTLVIDGTKTPTYNAGGKETGWTQDMVCPKGCGYSKTITHVHHFTNCGTCDAGDECDTACTGCSGNHVWGDATATECAKCECTMCDDCDAHPDDTDITKHSGWMPCSQDIEDDNDDGRAAGAHCQCQCLTFGHNAETAHDYQLAPGLAEYEPYNDEYHYHRIGKCSRCDQWKKRFQAHSYGQTPDEYTYVSPSVCRRKYKCSATGCGHTNNDDTHGHEVGSAVDAYVNVSASICRRLKKCGKCQSYVPDDTNGHVRDSANGCKCQNGCGYQFDHDYVTDACGNSACSYCGAYQYSQESHSGWDSKAGAADGHKCACGKTVIAHSFGTPTVISRVGWLVTYRETCSVCSYYHEWEEDVNPCKSGHVLNAQSTTCECLCGYYSPTGHVSQVESMHNFADTEDADGVKICTCKCGRFHAQRAFSTYRVNLGQACGNICAYCKEKTGTGLDIGKADDELHTPCEVSDGHCGCKCGKLTADGTNIEKFHIQKPGTCICLGSDGNGGAWHFRHPKDGCPKVCAYTPSKLYSGAEHCVASSAKEKVTPAQATPTDHSKVESGRCGCKCGTYGHANYASWTQYANLHNSKPYYCGCYCGHATESQINPYHKKPNDYACECQCQQHKVLSHVWTDSNCMCNCQYHEKQHRKQNNGLCTGVCHGPCNEYLSASSKEKHTPKEDGCGCECGQFSGHDYTGDKWHNGTGSPSCHCACGDKHHFRASACTKVCAVCGYDAEGVRNDSSIHSFPSGQCECNCGAFVDHKFAADKCECYCGDISRGHIYRQKTKTQTDSWSCSECGNTIKEYHIVWKCSRCGYEYDGTDSEEGHDPSCGNHDDPGEPQAYCEKHDLYYSGDECPKCKEEEDGDDSGGGGNETGGNGGLTDI